jgi:hypothetical protein
MITLELGRQSRFLSANDDEVGGLKARCRRATVVELTEGGHAAHRRLRHARGPRPSGWPIFRERNVSTQRTRCRILLTKPEMSPSAAGRVVTRRPVVDGAQV